MFDFDYVGIKASQFSFNRLQNTDPVLGVDMSSTGEVGCLGEDMNAALMTSMLSVGMVVPKKSILLSAGEPKHKTMLLDPARRLTAKGYQIYATKGTSQFLSEYNIPNTTVYLPDELEALQKAEENGFNSEAVQYSEAKRFNVLDMLHKKKIELVVSVPKEVDTENVNNGYKVRRAAIDLNVPVIPNPRLASAFIRSFCTLDLDDIQILSWKNITNILRHIVKKRHHA